jgi:hypothetical protein
MPITITVKQLALAVQSGALARFFAIDRPLQVAWKNRKQVSACETEYKLYQEKLTTLCERYGTKHPTNPNVYEFDKDDPTVVPGEEGPKKKLFNAEREILEEQIVDGIPGDPVKVSEASGFLKITDCEILENTFLID